MTARRWDSHGLRNMGGERRVGDLWRENIVKSNQKTIGPEMFYDALVIKDSLGESGLSESSWSQ